MVSDQRRPVPPALVGVEHELAIFGPSGRIEASSFSDQLAARGRRLRPNRPATVRLDCGAELSWEAGELEVASPPLPVTAGFIEEAVAWAGTALASARSALPHDSRLHGVSTHLSVSVDEDSMMASCAYFAYRFAPALMLLTEGSDSEGLLIRPRFGRLELGTDYVRGDMARGAIALAVGGVLACVAAARHVTDVRALPPKVDVRLEGATQRFGWYVDRTAFGGDICVTGRATVLARSGAPCSAQAHLEAAWASARSALAPFVSATDLEVAEGAVHARIALPCEVGVDRTPEAAPTRPREHALGAVVHDVAGPGFVARAVASTWEATVFDVTTVGARPFVPRVVDNRDAAIVTAAAALEAGLPPMLRRPSESGAREAGLVSALADSASWTRRTGLSDAVPAEVARYLRDHVWGRPPTSPRRLRLVGAALLAGGLGIALGGLLPPRSGAEVSASGLAGVTSAAAVVVSTVAPAPESTQAAPACTVISSVSFAGAEQRDGSWIAVFPVKVTRADGAPVAGAEVAIANSKSDGTSTSAQGTTADDGVVAFGVQTTAPGVNSIQIVDVRVNGCTWERDKGSISATGTAG